MALERVWCLATRSQDKTLAKFIDETVYGSPNADRDDEAHFIVIAKMDENQSLTFITGIDNTTPLTSLEYLFTNSADGAYRLIEFIPNFYNGATPYGRETKDSEGNITIYANVIWHPTSNKFYKAIYLNTPTFTGVEPSITVGWQNYWEEFTDFESQIAATTSGTNTDKIPYEIHDDIITFRLEDCIVEKLDCTTDTILCSVCDRLEELLPTLKVQLMLDGANSNNWQDKQTRSETIIEQTLKKFCC